MTVQPHHQINLPHPVLIPQLKSTVHHSNNHIRRQASFQYEGTHVQYPMLGAIHTRYLFFYNQDSYDREIQWRMTAYWQETNTTNSTTGAALMTAGLGTALALALMLLIKAHPRQTP